MKCLVKILMLIVLLGAVAQAATYYVAPEQGGRGTHDGLSAANAKDYLDSAFWTTVQTGLSTAIATVWFVDGTYNRGCLTLLNKGNATNKLYLKGVAGSNVQFTSSGTQLLIIDNSQNIEIRDLNFSGTGCTDHAILCRYSACRNIDIVSCQFTNLTNLMYAAVDIITGAHDIIVRECLFDTIGVVGHITHGVYAAHNCYKIKIHDNTFEDVAGSHVNLRDNVSDVNVFDNTFRSTGTYANEDLQPAITVHGGDDEYFGRDYSFHDNTFDFADRPRYSAIRWTHKGYEGSGGFYQIPNATEADYLENGGPEIKRGFLYGAGVDIDSQIYGNTYIGVDVRVGYGWCPSGGYWSYRNVSNAFYQTRWACDWEGSNDELVSWSVVENNPYTDVSVTSSNPAHGTYSARLTDTSASYRPDLVRSIGANITRGYYRMYVRINSLSAGYAEPVYTNSSDWLYWIRANKSDYKWGNNDGAFPSSTTWTTGTWYLLEMEFNFSSDKYTVWLNNSKIADNITIPTTNTSMSDNIKISPCVTTYQGDMQIDFTKLAVYESSTSSRKCVMDLPFDEASGTTANDATNYDNDGQLIGGITHPSDGISGRCFWFHGDNDYVRVPLNAVDFDFGNYMTVSCWMKTTADRSVYLISQDNSPNDYKYRLTVSSGAATFRVKHSDGTTPYAQATLSSSLFDGQWHHMVGTYNRFSSDGNRIKLYIDGELSASAAGYNYPILRGTDYLNIGKIGSTDWFYGSLDEVLLYNWALTADEVEDLYNSY
ncbi:MAG: hypothetical protein A2Y10_03725 [Planctomycetes bacterium GWF2_41_51]|nr:MAG: hypothetical protein A2Y10_03725 [Planctomycetes bacterium GWF2_41_51]HBG26050.1 hypothetical protein [Phycisphaerales bacterium]